MESSTTPAESAVARIRWIPELNAGAASEHPLDLDSLEIPLVCFELQESVLEALASSTQPALLALDTVAEVVDIGILQILQGDTVEILEYRRYTDEDLVEVQPRF